MTNMIVMIPAVLLGLVSGSFLNVVIYRLPLGKSVIKPHSACPGCGHIISWYENIPIISYIVLRGKCGQCGMKISVRYPVVEFMGPVIAVVAVYRFGYSIDALITFAFLMALLAITLIDWDYRIIPDEISLSFILIGIAWSLFTPGLTLLDSVLGAVVGGGGLWLVGAIYKMIRHMDGMGGGDVKLMGMIGAFLGIGLVLPVIVIASFFGSIYGVFLLKSRGGESKTAVAFGSFLAPAAAVCMLFGTQLLTWYFTKF